MFELIVSIIFLVSAFGIAVILLHKAPVLNTLSQNGSTGFKKHHFILNIENRIREFFVDIERQIFLHKILSWVKIMTLKVETRVDHLLHGIRKKAQKIDKDLNDKK